MQPIADLIPELRKPRRTVVTMHQKPDPDAMGSSLGLARFLSALGHEVTVISPTNWPVWLNWMPGCREVIDFEQSPDKGKKALVEAEWLFCLDFNVFTRTRNMAPLLYAFDGVRILIDHHQQPDKDQFQFGISDTSKSSTCEMVYDFIQAAGCGHLIDLDLCRCIYAGVMADTGSFRFQSTTASVHLMVADLLGRGLDHTEVHEHIYDNFLENRLRFIGHILTNRLEFFYEYNTALIAITRKDLLRFQIRTGDTEGLVNFPLSIQGIRMAALVVDRDEERKWSFRSKGGFDTNAFARKYFNGGGHLNASGGRTTDSLEETVARFRQALAENAALLQ